MTVVDLFAGPGGWDEGVRPLGVLPSGIELDPIACATARAAGHERIRADVSALNPREFAPAEGLLGSPPCPGFSAAVRALPGAYVADYSPRLVLIRR